MECGATSDPYSAADAASCELVSLGVQIFRNGDLDKPQDYNGPRDAAGIVSYLLKKAGPASKLLASQAEVLPAQLRVQYIGMRSWL